MRSDAKAAEYSKLVTIANNPNEVIEFQRLERNFAELASNAQWSIDNQDKTLHSARLRPCNPGEIVQAV